MAAAFATLVAVPASAHQFWVQPSEWRTEPGRALSLELRVGDHFEGDLVPRRAQHVERFFARRGDGKAEIEVRGVEGRSPAGFLPGQQSGLFLVGYASRPNQLVLEASKFESYLLEEGLEAVRDARAELGESLEPGREAYRRCAKSILVVGDGPAVGWDVPLGLALELVPEGNPLAPFETETGPQAFRLLYEGAPLAGALVVAELAGEPGARRAVRSDAQGRVELDLARPGEWLVHAVHMVRADDEAEYDWLSTWASLTFERRVDSRLTRAK